MEIPQPRLRVSMWFGALNRLGLILDSCTYLGQVPWPLCLTSKRTAIEPSSQGYLKKEMGHNS